MIPSSTFTDRAKSILAGPGWLVYLLAGIKFIFPYLVQNGAYEPHRDEFLYLAEARHLSWGYLEAPPMMSILAWVSNAMGAGMFWIKFWPSLFGSATFLVVARLIRTMGGGRFALLLGFLPFVCGYLTHVHFMFQPNFLEVFFWTLMAYGLIRHAQTGRVGGLYLSGLGLGLGMLSKYSVLFFAISLLVGLLLTKARSVLVNKHIYFALVLALLIFLPNFIWQTVHGFPVVYHMHALQLEQLHKVSQAGFLRDQLVFNLPGLLIWITGLSWLLFSSAARAYRFVGWSVVLVLAILVASHGKSYYAMGAYPTLFAFGAVLLARWTEGRSPVFRVGLIAWISILGLAVDSVSLPFLPPSPLSGYYARNSIFRHLGLLAWEDQKDHLLPQDFADMLSWREMTEKASRVFKSRTPENQRNLVLDCDNYGQAGALTYYGPTFQLPTVMSHAANFLLWVPVDFYQCNTVILITDDREEIHDDFVREFRYAAVVDSITNPYAREFGSYIILLDDPSQKFRKIWRDYYHALQQKTRIY
jgi:Dolichyl-phosphate-mannose-protein mannosyltransferase